LYNKNKYTTQLWIYGDSQERSLVGIGAVNHISLKSLAKEMDIEIEDMEELCNNEVIIKTVLGAINNIAKENKRTPFEFVKRLYLQPDEFNTDNDLATPTMKLKRPQLLAHFKGKIQEMYESIHEEEKEAAKAERKKSKKGGDKTTEKKRKR
jgi:long-chain acyl-CoA synthetase